MSSLLRRYPDRAYWAALLLVQLALTVIVWPVGNFPVNDDWAYAHSAIWLISENRIRLSDWIAMNLLPQTLMGGAAVYVFGFSFSVLRVVTELVALSTSLAMYGFFRVGGMGRALAFVSVVCVVGLPWWQILANSYMSDMYGMAFAISASYFFIRHIQSPRLGYLAMGTLFAVLGVLQRQVVAVVPLAFLLGWFLSGRPMTRKNLVTGLFPFVLTIAFELLYQGYLTHGAGVPEAQHYLHDRLVNMSIGVLTLDPKRVSWMFQNLFQMAGILGLSTAIWASLNLELFRDRRMRLTLVGLALAVIVATFFMGWLPPYRENNVLDIAGIGPFTLGNGMALAEVSIDRNKGLFWVMVGLLAGIGMAFLAALLMFTFRRMNKPMAPRRRGVLVFLMVAVVAYIIPFAITDYFDRYLIFVVPFLLLWAVIVFGKNTGRYFVFRNAVSITLLLGVGVLGAVVTHDYFAWNRARWQAITYAEHFLGASADNLDGGFEYNGFYNFEKIKAPGGADGKQWWWVIDDQYLVTFSSRAGYSEKKRFPVARYLTVTPPIIFLMEREGERPAP